MWTKWSKLEYLEKGDEKMTFRAFATRAKYMGMLKRLFMEYWRKDSVECTEQLKEQGNLEK